MLTIRKRGTDFHVCELSPSGGGYSQTTVQAFLAEKQALAFLKKIQPDQPFSEPEKPEAPKPEVKPAKRAKKAKK